ncbi:hypothetical protein LG943_03960 [Streptomonospora sp. S1-112]|uniref:Uncharacterized protein n=1 Tax=Streptomonospora mangrovi TaxID=2883123 RepID=A0A9X3SCB9_9ACTN|nr:hypothetical protein [Streptomonospora mangrovi]MDA0563488.1 hypothetical protein [Streptomonospora mangrovi]
MPLAEEDPRQLGPFRLSERVSSRAEGVVYRGSDARGRGVTVAMLSAGAAADPAARDRFRAAVRKGAGVPGAPRVAGSNLTGTAAVWVAVREGQGSGAEAFLAPVGIAGAGAAGGLGAAGKGGAGGGAEAAPAYAPYWAGRGGRPAGSVWSRAVGLRRSPPGAAAAAHPNWTVVAALLLVLLLFGVLMVVLFLLLQTVAPRAGQSPDPPPSFTPGSQPPTEAPTPTGEGTTPDEDGDQPLPTPSPGGPSVSPSGSDVPSVELDEDDYPPGGVPMDPDDQA